MKIKLISLLCLSVALSTSAQTPGYKERIKIINQNINSCFADTKTGLYLETTDSVENKGNHSFLWPLCALVQAANEMEVLEPSKQYLKPVMVAIQQYYSPRSPAPAYQAMVAKEKQDSRFYDDNEWVAIALMDAYNRTHNKQYLETSKMIYRFLLTGYTNEAGGGFYWEEGNRKSKNTCSNGPGILVALQLYKATGRKQYLDTALLAYNWTNKNLQAPSGLFYDNIKVPSLKIDSAIYTYNAGTMLQANVLLYNITHDKKYLTEARRIAKASEQYFYRNNRLPGNYWFNAVLLRGYQELYLVDKDKTQFRFFVDDANRIWQQERNDKNLLGQHRIKSLIDQAAMIEIYARLEEMGV